MANVYLKTNFSSITDKVITVWYEASAPSAEVGRRVTNAPHSEDAYTYTGLNPTVHIFKFYSSVDGIALTTLIPCTFTIDASSTGVPEVEILEFKVDSGLPVGDTVHTAPASGDTQYLNNNMASASITEVEIKQRGFGQLSISEGEIALITLGGFEWINGNKFNADDIYFITLYKSTGVQQLVSNSQFLDIEEITGNIDFDSTHYNNLLVAKLTTRGLISVPDFSTIPNHTTLNVETHESTKGLTILTNGTDTIPFKGQNRTAIYLEPGEEIRIVFKASKARVFHSDIGYNRLGQRIWGDIVEQNTVLRDGTEYDAVDYPRLFEWINSLPIAQVVSYLTWLTPATVTTPTGTKTVYPNKGFFTINSGATKFKVPDDRNRFIRAIKNTDGTTDLERLSQGAGGYQFDQLISHGHSINTTAGVPSTNDNCDPVRGTITGTPNSRGQAGTGKSIGVTGGTETRGENTGQLPLLCY